MADTPATPPETPPATPPETPPTSVDLSAFVPEDFKGEDGNFNTTAFREEFDGLRAFKGQFEAAQAELPKTADEYEFGLPEGFALPEGFDPKSLGHVDENGNEVAFDAASMINGDDPDLPGLKDLMHRIAQGETKTTDALKEIAGIVVNRELRQVMDAQKTAAEQKAALGPQGQTRIDTMTRTLNARLPEAQAKALLDGITSADALRGFEALVSAAKVPVPPAPGAQNFADMSIDERLAAGLEQRRTNRRA